MTQLINEAGPASATETGPTCALPHDLKPRHWTHRAGPVTLG